MPRFHQIGTIVMACARQRPSPRIVSREESRSEAQFGLKPGARSRTEVGTRESEIHDAELAAPVLLTAELAPAITADAAHSGMVSNSSGAAVANGGISVKNLATGQSTDTQSGTDGCYTAAHLPPGDYEVTVSNKGAAPKTAKTLARERTSPEPGSLRRFR
jgi:hypothetical protein